MPCVNSAISQLLQCCTEISSSWRELAKSHAPSRLRKNLVGLASSISACCGKCDNINLYWTLQNTHVNKNIAFWFAQNAKEYDACVEVRVLQSLGTSCCTSLYLRKWLNSLKTFLFQQNMMAHALRMAHAVNTLLPLYCLDRFIFHGGIRCFCVWNFSWDFK